MSAQDRTGEDRCWPCTLANLGVGILVGGLPLVLVVGSGALVPIVLAAGWALAVLAFTLYRLYAKGYLPGAERVARATGLHERIGPGSEARGDEPRP